MHADHQHQSGSSLFEVLVSVLVLGAGLLGAASVQTVALRNAGRALEFSQAADHGQALFEIMRSHRQQALAGQYHTGRWVCDAQAGGEIGRWMEGVHTALGESACAEITCQSGVAWCTLAIRWGDTGDSSAHKLTAGARL